MRIIFLGIAAAFFCADLTVCLVGYKKKYAGISAWTRLLVCPLLAAAHVLFLVGYLPDAKNILVLTALSLVCSSLGVMLTDFSPEKNGKRTAAGAAAFAAAGASYLFLLSPSFYLFPLPAWLFIYIAVFYAAAELYVIIRFFRKERPLFLVITAVYAAVILTLHFASLITAVGSLRLYSVPLFLGATALAFASFCAAKKAAGTGGMTFHTPEQRPEYEKIRADQQFVTMLLFALSQLLMCTGFCCMIAL